MKPIMPCSVRSIAGVELGVGITSAESKGVLSVAPDGVAEGMKRFWKTPGEGALRSGSGADVQSCVENTIGVGRRV